MTVTCYPVAGKAKSRDICQAFADGCGGQVVTDGKKRDGPSAFFGVDASNVEIWRATLKDLHHDYYYIDNAFFDSTRQTYFRVSKNRLQHSGAGKSDGVRFKSLNIPIKPWRKNGRTVILAPQSAHFMHMIAEVPGDWAQETKQRLMAMTIRPIRVREWSADKGALAVTLQADLAGAHALVTYSSAAAVTAVLCGVPVVTLGPSAAAPMSGRLEDIETLPMPDNREEWAGVLADNQFTLDEMRSGYAWARLRDCAFYPHNWQLELTGKK